MDEAKRNDCKKAQSHKMTFANHLYCYLGGWMAVNKSELVIKDKNKSCFRGGIQCKNDKKSEALDNPQLFSLQLQDPKQFQHTLKSSC